MNILYNKNILFLLFLFPLALCSDGDRSPFYQTCVKKCKEANCTLGKGIYLYKVIILAFVAYELLISKTFYVLFLKYLYTS